jgi:thiamine-monophosphate kinase
MGLQLLERERKLFEESDADIQPDLSGYEYIIGRQLKPEARRDIISALDEAGLVPNAMIDVSDGLSSDLLHICSQSGMGCRIFQDKIPIDPETAEAATEMNIEPFICALNGGEDYELLFTVPLDANDRVQNMDAVSIIGHITELNEGCKFVTTQGTEMELQAQGWNSLEG